MNFRFSGKIFIRYFTSLLRFVPDKATMEGKTDGLLFVRPRVPCSKLDLHDPNNFNWYSENCPGKYY